MWCPDSHANVTQWVDDVGSTHRKIQLQAMPNMNADMAMWFLTPMFPQTLSISGKVGWGCWWLHVVRSLLLRETAEAVVAVSCTQEQQLNHGQCCGLLISHIDLPTCN